MKKGLVLVAALAMGLPLTGCNSPGERALGGGAIGALGGAGIGAAVSGGRTNATLAGAAIGAAAGAATGALTAPAQAAPAPECARWGRDGYGNPVCRAYY